MGPSWTLGIELDVPLPYGGIDGWWGGRHLFTCAPRHGLLVPVSSVVQEPREPRPEHANEYVDEHPEPQPWRQAGDSTDWQHGRSASLGAASNGINALPEYLNQQNPKPAARWKNAPAFVQSLPLVEEETRQAVYDTRDHAQRQQVGEDGVLATATPTSSTPSSTPFAPPRLRNGVRQTRSGDFSAYSWQRVGAAPDVPDAVGTSTVTSSATARSRQVTRSSSAEALQDKGQGQPRPQRAVQRPHSGLFSFLKWFKPKSVAGATDDVAVVVPPNSKKCHRGAPKIVEDVDDDEEEEEEEEDGDDEDEDEDEDDVGHTVRGARSRASSYGSIASTATVSSFAFVSAVSAHHLALPRSPVQRRALLTADTDSYRQRIRQRDRRREAERNVSLRRKYRLYGSDSTIHSGLHFAGVSEPHRSHGDIASASTSPTYPDLVVPTLGRKKRRAPEPPGASAPGSSLPATLQHDRVARVAGVERDPGLYENATLRIGRYEHGDDVVRVHEHRRSASDSAATAVDKTAFLPAHVRGKRRAPTPPIGSEPGSQTGSTRGTGTRKKRPAPQPPGGPGATSALQAQGVVLGQRLERLKEEQLEQERLEKAETERLEKERDRKLQEERLEKERIDRERLDKERVERERLEKERVERERLEKERVERERLEKERAERERLEKERVERERLEKERAERERLEKDRVERERLEKERVERERLEKEREEEDRLEKERDERRRLEREKLERERLEKEIRERGRQQQQEKERSQRQRLEEDRKETAEQLKILKNEIEKTERELLENETIERLEREIRLAKETLERERLEKERLERLRIAKDMLDRRGSPKKIGGPGGSGGGGLSTQEKERLLSNINKLQAHAARISSPPSSPPSSPIVGVQRLGKENVAPGTVDGAAGPVPVSPRPWYKRSSSSHRDSGGGFKDIFKSLEKRAKDRDEDWMPESGVPRGGGGAGDGVASRFNIFSRLTEEWRGGGENKRRSQVSMLANISELDREAAEIVQEQHAREAALQAERDAKFYADVDAKEEEDDKENPEMPRKNSAKELISLFNAISSVSTASAPSSSFVFVSAGKESTSRAAVTSRTGAGPSKSAAGGALSEESFHVTAPLANVDDDVDDDVGLADNTPSAPLAPLDVEVPPPVPEVPQALLAPRTKSVAVANGFAVWVCPRCTLENPRWRFTCDACSMWRPAERRPARQDDDGLGPPPFLAEDKKAQEKAQATASQGGGLINWEQELKRYFQKDAVTSPSSAQEAKTTPAPTPMPAPVSVVKPQVTSQGQPRVVASEAVSSTTKASTSQGQSKTVTSEAVSSTTKASTSQWQSKAVTSEAVSSTTKASTSQWHFKAVTSEAVSSTTKASTIQGQSKAVPSEAASSTTKASTSQGQSKAVPSEAASSTTKASTSQGQSKAMISEAVSSSTKAVPRTIASPSLAVVKPQQSTFIGGLLKQDEARSKLTKSKSEDKTGHLLGGCSAPAKDVKSNDVEELRRARLAFFRSSTCTEDGNEASRAGPSSEDGDRLKLREMLKEMKHSLEADGASKGSAEGLRSRGEVNHSEQNKVVNAVEARTTQDEVRVRAMRPVTKVSSSAQTSAQVVRKVESPPQPVRPPPRQASQQANEAASEAVVQNGVLYTSLRKTARRIGTGTFELMRPRDFASISTSGPLYMNVSSSACQQHGVAVPVPAPVAVDSSPERRSTSSFTESAEFATPASASSSCSGASSRGGLQGASDSPSPSSISDRDAGSSRSASASFSGASGSASASASSRSRGRPHVLSPATSATPLSRGSSVDATSTSAPSSAGQLSRAASTSSSPGLSVVSDCSEVDRLAAQLSAPQGIAQFRADLDNSGTPTSPSTATDAKGGAPNVNTLAVNRLLRRLEATIANGQHQEAARLARDLARLKISCSVTRQRNQPNYITVDMFVEDKVSHQGPIPLQVCPAMTVGQLRAKVAREFQLPEHVQRWILGKQLANDMQRTLLDHDVTEAGCAVFLYLVAPESDADAEAGEAGPVSSPVISDAAPTEDPASTRRLPPPPPDVGRDPNRRGGWYFNYEEDRYSFCEDSDFSDGDLAEAAETANNRSRLTPPAPAPSTTTAPTPTPRRVMSPAPRNVTSPERALTSPVPAPRRNSSNFLATVTTTSTTTPATAVTPAAAQPQQQQQHQPAGLEPVKEPQQHPSVRPQTSGYRSQPLQTVLARPTSSSTPSTSAPRGPTGAGPVPQPSAPSAPAAASNPEPSTSSSTPTSRSTPTSLGSWRCPRCTLLNSGARPGCAACTAERPPLDEEGDATGRDAEELQRERQYQLLVNLERQDLVASLEAFECPVCLTEHRPGQGVVLRECLHTFCRTCLMHTVEFSEDAEVKCPYRDKQYACDGVLQEREIKALVPAAMYEQHLAKSMTQAERKMANAFHCKTPDCVGWCVFEDNVNEFRCPVCMTTNCLTCQAIHTDANCAEYQERLRREAEDGSNEDARRSQAMLDEMVARGEALSCPSCRVVLMKKWGCDWLRCTMCKTEICWVTRQPRWGPGGKGDTSGGCQCGVNGVKCHPKCNYCH